MLQTLNAVKLSLGCPKGLRWPTLESLKVFWENSTCAWTGSVFEGLKSATPLYMRTFFAKLWCNNRYFRMCAMCEFWTLKPCSSAFLFKILYRCEIRTQKLFSMHEHVCIDTKGRTRTISRNRMIVIAPSILQHNECCACQLQTHVQLRCLPVQHTWKWHHRRRYACTEWSYQSLHHKSGRFEAFFKRQN